VQCRGCELIAANQQQDAGPAVAAALAEVLQPLDKYISSAESIVRIAHADKVRAQAAMPEFLAAFEDLEGKMEAVSDRIERAAHTAEQDSQATIARSRFTGVVVLLVAAAIALVVAVWIVRAINVGLQCLITAIGYMTRGQLGRRITAHSTDEFGELLEALQVLDGKVGEIVTVVRISAQQTQRLLEHVNFFEVRGEATAGSSAVGAAYPHPAAPGARLSKAA
jgi:methyl-accepting chemotaxis protein